MMAMANPIPGFRRVETERKRDDAASARAAAAIENAVP
jgi:hypothetical protein